MTVSMVEARSQQHPAAVKRQRQRTQARTHASQVRSLPPAKLAGALPPACPGCAAPAAELAPGTGPGLSSAAELAPGAGGGLSSAALAQVACCCCCDEQPQAARA
eukprot:365847-Chlamydomonas_euryale.AAC.28